MVFGPDFMVHVVRKGPWPQLVAHFVLKVRRSREFSEIREGVVRVQAVRASTV